MTRKHSINFTGEKLITKQSFRDECDINNIMAKWKKTGLLEHLAAYPPTYGDFESVDDYQTQCDKVLAAQAAFDALPAAIRDRMDNDPGTFMAFMHDPANVEEARELGLLMQKAPEDPPIPKKSPEGDPEPAPTPQNPSPSPVSGGE